MAQAGINHSEPSYRLGTGGSGLVGGGPGHGGYLIDPAGIVKVR